MVLVLWVLNYYAILLQYLKSLFITKITALNLLLNTFASNSVVVIDLFDLISCHIHCNWTLHILWGPFPLSTLRMYQRLGAVMCADANYCRFLPAPPSDRLAESLLMWRLPRGSSASNRLKIFNIDSHGPLTCNRGTRFVVNHSELLYSLTTFQKLQIISEYLKKPFYWEVANLRNILMLY
jgi:hypothetical protein